MTRAPMQTKITILWGSKAVYEKLSVDLFWVILNVENRLFYLLKNTVQNGIEKHFL